MKKNIIDAISLKMMDNATHRGLSESTIYSDTDIISDISKIPNINEQGLTDGRTLLIHAAAYNRKKIVEYLLKNNAEMQLKDNLGFSALHAAVACSNKEIVELLLSHGAPVNITDNLGNIPLFRASHNDPEIIKLLVDFGSDYNHKNNRYISPYIKFQAYPTILELFK